MSAPASATPRSSANFEAASCPRRPAGHAVPPPGWRLRRCPRAGLVVLDLNLPRRTGLEVLAALKADRDLLPIPVLILATSAAPPDLQRSYSLHASAYVSKPADFDGFTDAIRQIAHWFLELIELPRPS